MYELYCLVGCCSKVAPGSLNRAFKNVMNTDNLFPNYFWIFLGMDLWWRCYEALVPNRPMYATALSATAYAFETVWLFQFWKHDSLQGHKALATNQFENFTRYYDIQLGPIPAGTTKNAHESRHHVTQSIFFRLVHALNDTIGSLHANLLREYLKNFPRCIRVWHRVGFELANE